MTSLDHGPSPRVKERGHWRMVVALRGSDASATLDQPLPALVGILQRAEVSKRGWNLPVVHLDGISNHDPYVEGGSRWARYHERWRLFRDGVFLMEQGLRDDWNEYHFAEAKNRPNELNLVDAIYTLTEMFLFASRLGSGWRDVASVWMRIELQNVAGRTLWMSDQNRAWMHTYTNSAPTLKPIDNNYDLVDLTERSEELARDAAVHLFQSFGWTPAPEVLVSIQASLGRW